MKAAVLHQLGSAPKYEDFPDPVPGEGQLLMNVKAASVKNIDKLRAGGIHYASYTKLPEIVGLDAVGTLEDGTRIYAQGVGGTIAEKTLVRSGTYVLLPEGLDDITAAALPNAVYGSVMALLFRAKMKKGEVVLINGATSVTGQFAVQAARHYGASKIIVTGRNETILEELKGMGAAEIISLKQEDPIIINRLKELHSIKPIDIVIDYLWGNPVKLIINALKGSGVNNFSTRVRIVSVGSEAGKDIILESDTIRSSAIEILGSGIGSLSLDDLKKFGSEVLPEMFMLAAEGKLKIQTETAELKDIESVWQKNMDPGKRLVIKI
ncbi:MAG TPA: zinc-binding alcohol dehydrogenase family protein [Puia sp.]|nr:zinc-binding alcohol dehydrogenase family protein [Puia sp.]